jgi:hypothetical protein
MSLLRGEGIPGLLNRSSKLAEQGKEGSDKEEAKGKNKNLQTTISRLGSDNSPLTTSTKKSQHI